MKAIHRFALHTLLPPLGGGILITGTLVLTIGSASLSSALLLMLGGLLYAYAIALVPSLVYAAVMEFAACWWGVEPGSRRAIWLSAGLGGLVGALPLISPNTWTHWQWLILVLAVGFVVGLAVEWLIGRIARRCCTDPETTSWDSLRSHGW